MLNGQVKPNDIPVWTPFLIVEEELVSGKPFSVKGESPGITRNVPSPEILDLEPLDPATVTGMKIARVDASQYPRINVQLSLDDPGNVAILPQHFKVRDNAKPVSVMVSKLHREGAAVSIVSDVSGSMVTIGAFEIAKQAVIRLAESLASDMLVGLISFAYGSKVEVPLQPLGSGDDIRTAASNLVSRSDTGIFVALNTAAADDVLSGGTIVLLTDGEDTVGGSEADVIANLKAKNIRVIGVALGEEANVDLLNRIATATGGISMKITKVDDLDLIYEKIGRSLSSHTTLTYTLGDAELNLTPSENSSNEDASLSEQRRIREVNVELSKSSLVDQQSYVPPREPVRVDPKLYLVIRTGTHAGPSDYGGLVLRHNIVERDIYWLNARNVGWGLAGQLDLYFDHGTFSPDILTASYVSKWIDYLRAVAAEAELQSEEENSRRHSWELVTRINGFRTLATLGAGVKGSVSPGVNVYMQRSSFSPMGDEIKEQVIFDIVNRWIRALGTGGVSDTFHFDVAAVMAEGLVLDDARNAVDGLLAHADNLDGTRESAVPPEYWTEHIRQLQNRFGIQHNWMITAETAPEWLWVARENTEYGFAGYYVDEGFLAKGASLESLAADFDKIDRMYKLYSKVGSKTPGLNSSMGILLKAIADFKREENKIWCYSTLMMGQVADAIGDEDALLNQSPNQAKEKAAQLCKLDYDPDEFAQQAGKAAAKSVAKSWTDTNLKKQFGPLASIFGIGMTSESVSSSNFTASDFGALLQTPAKTPLSPSFHEAIKRIHQAPVEN